MFTTLVFLSLLPLSQRSLAKNDDESSQKHGKWTKVALKIQGRALKIYLKTD